MHPYLTPLVQNQTAWSPPLLYSQHYQQGSAAIGADARSLDFAGGGSSSGTPGMTTVKKPASPFDLLAQKMTAAGVPKAAAQVVSSVASGVTKKANQAKIAKSKAVEAVRADARKTATLNIPYTQTRAAADKKALEFNNYIATTSAGKAGIDWGTLPAFVGIVAGAATGGPAGAVAGAAKGIKQSGSKGKMTLDLAGDVPGVVANAAAHEILETTELGDLAAAGKQIVKDGIDVTNEVLADAALVNDLLTNTGAAAAVGSPEAIVTMQALTGAMNERAAGIVRERVQRVNLADSGYLRSFTPEETTAIVNNAAEMLAPEWAVLARGTVQRIVGKVPAGAKWLVRGGRVERA